MSKQDREGMSVQEKIDADSLLQELREHALSVEEAIVARQRELANEDHDKEAEGDAIQFLNTINRLGQDFELLCAERHLKGQEEYGKFTFLENDVVRMMIEELADTANYCRYQAVKLLLLQEAMERQLQGSGLVKDGEEQITLGVSAFKGTSDVGWRPS